MAEILYKITLSGNETPVEGCESLTEEQAQAWLSTNQETFEVENENSDLAKYIVVPLSGE